MARNTSYLEQNGERGHTVQDILLTERTSEQQLGQPSQDMQVALPVNPGEGGVDERVEEAGEGGTP